MIEPRACRVRGRLARMTVWGAQFRRSPVFARRCNLISPQFSSCHFSGIVVQYDIR